MTNVARLAEPFGHQVDRQQASAAQRLGEFRQRERNVGADSTGMGPAPERIRTGGGERDRRGRDILELDGPEFH